jgi:hypothetical protein
VKAEEEREAEFSYMTNPDAFIFDREEVSSELVAAHRIMKPFRKG